MASPSRPQLAPRQLKKATPLLTRLRLKKLRAALLAAVQLKAAAPLKVAVLLKVAVQLKAAVQLKVAAPLKVAALQKANRL